MEMEVWKGRLLHIGESYIEHGASIRWEDHLVECCAEICHQYEQQPANNFSELVCQCAEQLPHKIPLFACLTGLINKTLMKFGKDVVDKTVDNLKDALHRENCDRSRILIRFITSLMCSKVVDPTCLMKTFEELQSCAKRLHRSNFCLRPQADFYIYCILASLPWGGSELRKSLPKEFENLMGNLKEYINIRWQVPASFSVFETNEDNSPNTNDVIKNLWDIIEDLNRNGWRVETVFEPHLSFKERLVRGTSHSFSPISVSTHTSSDPASRTSGGQKIYLKYPPKIRRLHICPSHKEKDMQPIDSFVTEENISDILRLYNQSAKKCAFYLVNLHVPCDYKYLVVDTIFSQLLLLPRSTLCPVQCGLLVTELCKGSARFSFAVEEAVSNLFDRVSDMDMECRTRLILWFSRQLAIHKFCWPWHAWSYVGDLPVWSPRRSFVTEVLKRQIWLTSLKDVQESVGYVPSIDKLLSEEFLPKYGKEESTLGEEFGGLIRRRSRIPMVVSLIEGKEEKMELVAEIVFQAFRITEGKDDMDHIITTLSTIVSNLFSKERKQITLLNYISAHWYKKPCMTSALIEKLMFKGCISAATAVKWIFQGVRQFDLSVHLWEIILVSIDRAQDDITEVRKKSEVGHSNEQIQSLTKTHKDLVQMVLRELVGLLSAAISEVHNISAYATSQLDDEDKYKLHCCIGILGYLKSFSRQYALPVWSNTAKLCEEVLDQNVDPLILKTIACGFGEETYASGQLNEYQFVRNSLKQKGSFVEKSLKRKGSFMENSPKKQRSESALPDIKEADKPTVQKDTIEADLAIIKNLEINLYQYRKKRAKDKINEIELKEEDYVVASVQSPEDVIKFIEKAVKTEDDDKPYLSIPSRRAKLQEFHPRLRRLVLQRKQIKRYIHKPLGKMMMQALKVIQRVLERKIHITKRQLFYYDPELYKVQSKSDRILEDTACMVACNRSSLGVTAKERGVVVGNLRFTDDGQEIDCMKVGTSGTTITCHTEKVKDIRSGALFVLVVEKGATFQRLSEDKIYERFPCVLITARGMPDIATRMFVQRLERELSIPILALMDCDPAGIKILSVFAYGSERMSYDSRSLTTPDIHWLGLLPSDLETFEVPKRCRRKLTGEERNNIQEMLKKDFMEHNYIWKIELERMLESNEKADISALCSIDLQYLTEKFIPRKLQSIAWPW